MLIDMKLARLSGGWHLLVGVSKGFPCREGFESVSTIEVPGSIRAAVWLCYDSFSPVPHSSCYHPLLERPGRNMSEAC